MWEHQLSRSYGAWVPIIGPQVHVSRKKVGFKIL